MDYKKVTAIIPFLALDKVKGQLKKLDIGGLSVSEVKGFGDYKNYYSEDEMTVNYKIEIFTPADKVEEISSAIMDAAHTGMMEDGIVAILPVEKLYRIRNRAEYS